MGKEILTFGDTEIEKDKFYRCESKFFRRCRYCECISILQDFFWWKKL